MERKDLRTYKTLCSTEELAYIAGLIDGEGSFVISQVADITRRYQVRHGFQLSIANTNREVLVWVQCKLGGSLIYHKQRNDWKPHWSWVTRSRWEASGIIHLIQPYLRIKSAQAEVALRFLDTIRRGKFHIDDTKFNLRNQLRDEMRQLNHRGQEALS